MNALWSRRDRQQCRLLSRTFFARAFESDVMPAGLPQVRLVTSAIAAIAVPLTVLPVSMRISGGLQVFFQYTLAMIAFAFIALLLWEGIFPDRRDARILSALPIRTRTFVLARLGALAALFSIFAAGGASLPVVAFTPVGNPLAHLAGFMGVASFAFFSIVAVQCVVLNVAGRAAAQRLAILLQIVLVITVLQTLTVVPPEFLFTGDARTPPTGASRWLPSIWFIGLHEVIDGRGNEVSRALASDALAAAGWTPLLTVLLYAATYRRLIRLAIEGEAPASRTRSAPALVGAALKRALAFSIRSSITRAVCFFVLQTIARSRRHKMMLAMHMGVAIAMVLSVVLPRAVQRGADGFAIPDAALLALPLVIIFFALVAVRALIAVPVEIKANWVLRLREPAERSAAVSGIVAAMVAAGVVPVCAFAFLIASSLWGVAIAVEHTLFVAALGALLAQALVVRLQNFPFACTYLPGASRMRVLWPFYLMLFSAYTWTMGGYQARAFQDGDSLIEESLLIAAAATGLFAVRVLRLRSGTGLRFEPEDPEALFEGFRLSESLAAQQAREAPKP